MTCSLQGEDAEAGTQDESADAPAGLLDPEPGDIQTVPVRDTIYSAAASFEDLPLSRELLQGLYTEMKFEKPSRIQALTLPMILTPPFRSLIAQVGLRNCNLRFLPAPQSTLLLACRQGASREPCLMPWSHLPSQS